MSNDTGLGLFMVALAFMAYVQHLENESCRDRGGKVIEGFWSDDCEEESTRTPCRESQLNDH